MWCESATYVLVNLIRAFLYSTKHDLDMYFLMSSTPTLAQVEVVFWCIAQYKSCTCIRLDSGQGSASVGGVRNGSADDDLYPTKQPVGLSIFTNSTLAVHRGVGCIFVEMLSGKPLFPGIKGVYDQLNKIWNVSEYEHSN